MEASEGREAKARGIRASLKAPLAVLDSGIVIRALAGSEDASSYRLVRGVSTGELRLAISDGFLRELADVARRPAISRRLDSARSLDVGLDLGIHGEMRRPRRLDWPSVPDPKDWRMPDLALDSGADFIVTWDGHRTLASRVTIVAKRFSRRFWRFSWRPSS